MEKLIIRNEFVGRYISPANPDYEYYEKEEFHDPIIKGYLFSNDLVIIEFYLIKHSWLLNDQDNFFGNTALFLACEYDIKDVVILLLNYRAKISLKNIFGWTAYDVAKYHYSFESIRVLEKRAAIIIEEAWINYIQSKIVNNIRSDLESKLKLF